MLPRKLNIFCALVLLVACAIEDSATQNALDRFHQLPVSCYHCSDGDCATNYLGRILKCTGDESQACATAFAADGTVTARGCRDAVTETCASGNCQYCQSTACNDAQSLADYVDCIDCDTATNPNCLYNPSEITTTRKCKNSCITALYERKNSSLAYDLARTCLDDYDLDERESCEAGQLENCSACTTANCNTVKLPAEVRKICYMCEGEGCEDPQPLECPAYRSNDQCFTEFDAQNDISRMGCASSLNDDYILSKKRSIYLCDTDNCNLYSAQAYDCASCNSQDDANCINALTGTVKTCSVYPYTQCASYLTETGELVRDCVYNVPGDDLFDACLSSNNSVCQVCTGNSCNRAVFPENRRSCMRCDASFDTNCDTGSTEYVSYCSKYKPNDNCVISVIDGLTRRGCESDFSCDSSDTGSCRICSDNNCNTANLVQNNIGEPGRFQDLPLSCYNCEGASCANALGELQTCSNNNLQNCMTVFDAQNAVTRRGCSDAVLQNFTSYCDQNADKCFSCKSNNCNNALALTDFIDCYFCDSANRQNCAVNFSGSRTRKCKAACMTILYPGSLETNPTYETLRSCLDDLEAEQQTSCSLGENAFCSACTTNNCNDNELPEDRVACLHCLDDSCQNVASKKCDTYATDDQCYALFNEERNITNLGCRSALKPDTVENLIRLQQLWVCNGTNCNDVNNLPAAKSCLVCNSESDVRCASNPSALSTYQTCAATPYTDCTTRITATGATQRGCLSTLEEDNFYSCFKGSDALCATCSTDNCNSDNIFPANRQQCQQCTSATNASCTDAPDNVVVCPIYAADDTCVSTIKNTYTVRGCSSSLACDNDNDLASCRKCGTAGCNTVNLEKNYAQGAPGRWQGLPISCYTCNDSTTCATLDNAVQCSTNINQHCLTIFNSAGTVVQRGCSDDVLATQAEYCDANADNCLGCNSNNCNIASALTDYIDCWFCDTERDGSCVYDIANLKNSRKCYRQCMSALYPRTNETNPAYGMSRSCLDDLELLDRSACANGSKDNCVACTGNQCNTASIPFQRLRCYHCQNEDCAAPTEHECAQYRANDVCYTQYDETQAIARLGCRSDYEEDDAEYLVSQKRLLYCTGNSCNSLTAVPAPQICTLCNSRTDTNCASSPLDVISRVTCDSRPYTECYTRWLDDGATERGCLSSLEDNEFYECLKGTNETCKTCTGTRCNSDLFPATRIACHICNSRTTSACESSPDSLTVCPIYDAAQSCVSTVRDGVTYRGCSKQLVCDSLDAKGCQVCSEDGCNTENLISKIDNNFGKWQDLPLTCWDCSGDACTSNTLTEQQCSNNLEQDCLTVFDANNNVVRRGCADEVNTEYAQWCSQNANLCLNCKSNKCNSATALSSYINCVSCDSYYNSDCLYNVSAVTTRRSCEGSCMTALYPAVVSSKPSYELIRSCLNDKESSDQQTCSSGRDTLCSACNTENCNTAVIPPTRSICYLCSAENCDEPVSNYCPRYAEDDECFILFDETNSVTEMGCISSTNLNEEELVGTKRIYKCSGDNCNSLSNIPATQQCVTCDSTTNPLCATNAYAVITINTCATLPYTKCYTLIDESGTTLRGCLSDLQNSTFTNCALNKDEKCQVCEGDGCNREIFPADRLMCYNCDGASDQTCDATPAESEYCSIYTPDTSCVTALMGGNVTVRGCNSDILCDATDKSSCRSCTKSNCNSIKLVDKEDDGYHGVWQPLPLSCYACEGEQCAYSLGVSSSCSVNNEQDCMTVFETNGTVRRRGCSDDVEDYEDLYCRKNPSLCFKCKSNDCNIAWSTSDYIECLFCDSGVNAECATHPQNSAFNSRSCYKQCMVASKTDNTIIRSCLDDKEVFNQTTCLSSNSRVCASCSTDNCNDFVFPRPAVSCHVCADSACTTSVSQDCNFSVEGDNFCFAKYENNVPTLLGCGNSESAQNLSQWISDKTAYICDTDNCNQLSELPTAISCVSCNSTAACAQTPNQVSQYDTCNPLIQQCISFITADGKTVRGCVSDLPYETEYSCVRDGSCDICESDRCNNEIYPKDRRVCYICNAAINPSCADPLNSNLSQVCPIFEPADACLSRVVNGYVERGCASELNCNENDPSTCVLCGDDNCNTAQFSTTVKPTDPPATTETTGGSTSDAPTDKTTENPEDNAASLTTSSLLSLLLCYAITLVLKWH